WCGKGLAMRARGMGASVIVTEIDAIKALEAAMEGFRVMPMSEAAKEGDLFVTVTGDIGVLRREHFKVMKDGAVVCNSGHFDVEIDIPALKKVSSKVQKGVRAFVDEYVIEQPSSAKASARQGKRIYLLADGRLVNLAAAEGHPASVMDMSFSTQALAAEWLSHRGKASTLTAGVYEVSDEIEEMVARTKLASMRVAIDTLTPQQQKYLSSWQEGT
ncbi:MAG: Adenosylhomocysteinase, partial [Candidatus Kaiserbacteria bacterium GW2011_GWB1_52_6]